MKKLFILFIFTIAIIQCNCQTRKADYDYIIDHYAGADADSNYAISQLTSSEISLADGRKAILKFVRFKSRDSSKNRGIAIVYKELSDTEELSRKIVLCLPEKNSGAAIENNYFESINNINDTFVLKYIAMGLSKLVNK